MKNDELFDMITELKIDDEYVEEALTGGSDSDGAKVYAGRQTRVSPLRIIASVAACLAVFAAAGLIFANIGRLPIGVNNGAGLSGNSGESLSDEEKISQVLEDFKNRYENSSPFSDAQFKAEGYIQQLIDKYDVPAYVFSLNSSVNYYDIDNDGTDETVIEFEGCKQLPGIYIFSPDNRLIGALSHEEEPIDPPVTENDIIKTYERYTPLCTRTEDGKNHYYYCTYLQRYREPENGVPIEVEVWTTYEIVVNDDGTLSTIKALEWGGNIEQGEDINRVYGVDVSPEEFRDEEHKYNPLPDNPFAR